MPRKKKSDIVQIDRTDGKIIEVPAGMEFIKDKNNEIKGAVIRKSNPVASQFLRNSRDYAIGGDDTIHQQIKLCKTMYYKEGIVGTAIDTFVDYGNKGFELEDVKDSKEKDIIQYWLDNLNKDNMNVEQGIKPFTGELMLEYWQSANAFPYITSERINSTEISSKNIRGKKLMLPMNIYLMNPLFIHIPEIPFAFADKEILIRLESNFTSSLMDRDDILKHFPLDIANKIKNSQGRAIDIALPKENIYHIKRKSLSYQVWGTPYLVRAFSDLARKKKLQALDESTIEGLINSIIVFKIGDPNNPLTWRQEKVLNFSSLINNPDAGSNILCYTPDVDYIQVEPKGDVLAFDKKYQQVDKGILQAIGMPTVLLSGEGMGSDNTENVWVSISTLVEKIESCRDQIGNYLKWVIRTKIIEENNLDIKNMPELRWKKINLKNEKEFRDFVLGLYDRGILPIETTVTESGYSWEEICIKRAGELTDKIFGHSYEEVFTRRDIAFSAPGEPAPGSKGGKGRPTKTNQKPKKTTPSNAISKKPKVKSGIFEDSKPIILNELEVLAEECKLGNGDSDLYIIGRFERMSDILKNSCEINNTEFESIKNKLDDIKDELNIRIEQAHESKDKFLKEAILDKAFSSLNSSFDAILDL